MNRNKKIRRYNKKCIKELNYLKWTEMDDFHSCKYCYYVKDKEWEVLYEMFDNTKNVRKLIDV